MTKPRARDLGIPFEGVPGTHNAITDVDGVEVGYTTLIAGEAVRTGVTILHPRGKDSHLPVFAGWHALNGNGEMTGTAWIEEGGFIEGAIGLTNTHSVGIVRDTIIAWEVAHQALVQRWSMPVVAETADGWLNDMNGFHVKPEHALSALDEARGGPVEEGNVGGGTGMVCFGFKGGTGTASRLLPEPAGAYTVGALVQANYGRRGELIIAGVPVGKHMLEYAPFAPHQPHDGQGSLVAVIATDAPLLPHQLRRLARRGALGMARTGGMASNSSGDLFVAFSTANPDAGGHGPLVTLTDVPNERMDPLLHAATYAVEEAIINALVGAETMTGRQGLTAAALPHHELQDVLGHHGRLEG
ncbi:MAG TPA: P1 family peptidase [Anaerolineales bacterium]|nr:P1 family peptidase [Anaerolineales bacterium]